MSTSANKAQKKATAKPSRGWMITINNPIIPLEMYLKQWLNDGNIVFGCGQTEKGAQGTRHHQTYIVTKVNDTNRHGFGIKWMKENIHSSAHFEPRHGTHQQAVEYCTKEDTRIEGPWTVGAWSPEEAKASGGKKGNATYKKNVADLFKKADQGASDRELAMEFPHLWAQHYKALDRYRLLAVQGEHREQPYIVVLHGPTGTGKSHRAQQIVDNNGGGFTFRRGNGGNMWADGYDPLRHPVVVFDEMDGGFMPYRQLLRICDKWPLVLDTKGGAVNFCPKIIVLTSHKHPKEWYSVEAVPDTTELMRRLSGQYGAIINMTIPYAVVREAGPDLADVIDLLETGDLVDNMRQAIEQDEIIDLTCSQELDDEQVEVECVCGRTHPHTSCQDIDNQEGPTPPEWEEYDPDAYAEEVEPSQGHMHQISLAEAQRMRFINQEDFDADFPPSQNPCKVYCDCMYGDMPCDVIAKLRRTDTSRFEVVAPPKASAAEFRKHKQIPGQSKLALVPTSLHKVNDDED